VLAAVDLFCFGQVSCRLQMAIHDAGDTASWKKISAHIMNLKYNMGYETIL
jgi:hypothetical protein